MTQNSQLTTDNDIKGEPSFAALAALEPLMDKCVHCGFCLSTCPSYLMLGQEMDSPRGRIYLMKAVVQNRAAVSESVVRHFDTCLGCMACETACPSGVLYAPLIEETRAAIEREHPRGAADRLFRRILFLLLSYPARLPPRSPVPPPRPSPPRPPCVCSCCRSRPST